MENNYFYALRDFWAKMYYESKNLPCLLDGDILKCLKEIAPQKADEVLSKYKSISNEEKIEIKSKLLDINFEQFIEDDDD